MAEHTAQTGATVPLTLDFISHSPEQTYRVGRRIGQHTRPGDLFLLSGPFGAGKTLLTQGLATGLNIADWITSPSFTLINEHDGRTNDGAAIRLYHVDLYRLESVAAVDSIGLDDILADPAGVCAIEWPDRLGNLPEANYLLIVLTPVSETKRRLTLQPVGERYSNLLAEIRAEAFGVGD